MVGLEAGVFQLTPQTWLLFLFSTGSSYYDNVRPLAYPDSDAVLICFDISRPETLDSVIKKVRVYLIPPPPPSPLLPGGL